MEAFGRTQTDPLWTDTSLSLFRHPFNFLNPAPGSCMCHIMGGTTGTISHALSSLDVFDPTGAIVAVSDDSLPNITFCADLPFESIDFACPSKTWLHWALYLITPVMLMAERKKNTTFTTQDEAKFLNIERKSNDFLHWQNRLWCSNWAQDQITEETVKCTCSAEEEPNNVKMTVLPPVGLISNYNLEITLLYL